ncbi:MAG: hypothetical protein U1F28_03695 [Acinetobacter sp.]
MLISGETSSTANAIDLTPMIATVTGTPPVPGTPCISQRMVV